MADEPVQPASSRAHHPDSPSSLQSSEACPLFENQQRESKASSDGTLLHLAVETRNPLLLDGDEPKLAAYNFAVAYEDRVVAEHTKRFGAPPKIFREIYLPVGDDYAGEKIVGGLTVGEWVGVTGGFPDILIVSPQLIDCIDWKFGRVPVVPTKDNVQGLSYKTAALQAFPGIPQCRVHFVAPLQGWSEAEHLAKYVHTFSRSELPASEARIRTIVARKKAANKELLERGSWAAAQPKMDLCIWCARAGDCKKAHAIIIKGSEKHPDFIVPDVVVPLQLTRADQYKQAFRWANQVESIAKAIKKRCADAVLTEDLDLGEDMKVVKRTERQIKSFAELIAVARRQGLRLRELVPFMTIGIGKIEDAVKAKAPKGRGAAAIRAFGEDAIESGALEYGTPIYFLQEARSPKEKAQQTIEINT